MAAADKKASIADALDEQYYQINLDILESFSKYRPPLNLFRFKEDVARVLPYWNEAIAPTIRSGKRVLIAAHGNSIRALVKYLDGISDQDIVGLNIPNGIPLVYELDAELKPLRSYYLGDAEAAAKAAAAVASQSKA